MKKNEIIEKCKELNCSTDYLYYIVEDKSSGAKSIVCSGWNFLMSNDCNQFAGVTIYTTINNLTNEQKEVFKSCKYIRGEEYVKVCSKYVDGLYYNLTF